MHRKIVSQLWGTQIFLRHIRKVPMAIERKQIEILLIKKDQLIKEKGRDWEKNVHNPYISSKRLASKLHQKTPTQ